MFNLRNYILLLVFLLIISSNAFAKNKKKDIEMSSLLAEANLKGTMAMIYLHNNNHTLSDFKDAFSDALFAATNDNAKGQYALAMLYDRLYSAGDDKSGIECLNWLHKSVDHGFPDAIAELGYFYTIGKHVKKDPEKGFNLINGSVSDKYLKDTMGAPSFKGYYYLSLCYRDGIGTPPNTEEYINTLLFSNYNNFIHFELGREYLLGRYINKDEKKGWEYIKKSAQSENSDAMLMLGLEYLSNNSTVVNHDVQNGTDLITKASFQCNPDSFLPTSTLYFNGDGVLPNYIKSYAWFVLAKANRPNNGEMKQMEVKLKNVISHASIVEAQSLAEKYNELFCQLRVTN